MNPRAAFLRTICDCKECTRFCRAMPGPLIPGDERLIADHLNITVEQLEEKLRDKSTASRLEFAPSLIGYSVNDLAFGATVRLTF